MIGFETRPVFLAPLARVSILPYRILCRELGASATITEMVPVKTLIARAPDQFPLAKDPREVPVGIQLVGSDPIDFKEAVRIINDTGHYGWIDINFGCPAPDITRAKMGAQLLTDLKRAGKIMETAVKYADLPVSVKIRLGFQSGNDISFEMVDLARDCGIAFITVHARFASSSYQEPADWKRLGEIKSHSDIPVVGNGDIRIPEDINRMFEETGVDGVMIGRAAKKNPLIFARKVPTRDEMIETWKLFVDICREKNVPFQKIRQFATYFFRDFPGAAVLRNRVSRAAGLEEVEQLLEEVHQVYDF
ncbi:MAG: tRNA dihydrouridine synthase [Candidatus Odinarchaeota archaeon]